MTISSMIIGIVFLGLYWILIKFVINHKNVLAKPEAEQVKLKKQLYLGMAFAFIVYLGAQLLINSKTTGWIPWVIIATYLALWGFGGYLIWLAYRLGIKKEIALVKKSNGQLFSNPSKFIRSIAIINLVTGLSILLLAVAIPIFKIKLDLWAPVIVIISACKQLIFSRFEKKDAT
jgi:cytochrome c biogenesis protein CcdA